MNQVHRLVSIPLILLLIVAAPGCRTGRDKTDTRLEIETRTTAPEPRKILDQVTAPPNPTTDQDPQRAEIPPSLREFQEQVVRDGLLGEVYYGFDRADLLPDARQRLEKNAVFLQSRPQVRLMIEGHCDERGTNEYNLALGHRRASVARDFLISLGIAPERLQLISYGEEMNVCHASAESCWRKNRRAYFRVTEL